MNATNQSFNSSKELCSFWHSIIHDDYVVVDYVSIVLAIIINLLTCPFIILLNALFITAVKTKRRLQTTYNILLACLAVTDLLVGIGAQPAFITLEIVILNGGGSSHLACRLFNMIELRLNNLTTSVSSIEMSVSRLEKEVSALDSNTKTIEKSVNELKESVSFCEDEIEEMKKNAYDIKEDCSSDIDDLRKQILYFEHYSRRENLKFVGIPEKIISADEDDARSSEDTKQLVYKFKEDELAIENPQQKIEF
ncbi:hypothetical protein ACROYT_G005239 [Oculina patagonica]